MFDKKKLRYYYWILLEFSKKNAKLILLSFFLSVLGFISLVSLTPLILSFTGTKTDVIGVVKSSQTSELPQDILSKISNGLLFVNEKGEIIPILADKWEIKDKGKEYDFYLKKNLFWNNGDALTTKDLGYQFKDIDVIIVDESHIQFKLKKPLPIFPLYLTRPILKYPYIGAAGLYTVDRYKVQGGFLQELYLTPNKPNFPALVYKFYENETKMINAYKLGQITQMTVTNKSIADTFAPWKNTTIEKSVDYSNLVTLFFNTNNQYLKPKEVRQAIAMSIDHELFQGLGEESNGPIPPVSWAANSQIHQILYNPDLAKKILKPSGDKKEELSLSTYDDFLDLSDKFQGALSDKGIQLNVNVLYEKPASFDLLLANWKVPFDPDQYYFWHSTQTQGNITGYKNEKVDKLLEDGRNTTNVTDRKKLYADFQKVLVDDVPAYFLYYPYVYTIKRK